MRMFSKVPVVGRVSLSTERYPIQSLKLNLSTSLHFPVYFTKVNRHLVIAKSFASVFATSLLAINDNFGWIFWKYQSTLGLFNLILIKSYS